MSPTQKRLLKLREAGELFSVPYDLLHDAILEDRLPAIRPSRAWLVKPNDVEAFLLAEHERTSAERERKAAGR